MTDEKLKPCPNPECNNADQDRLLNLRTIKPNCHVNCSLCQMTGPLASTRKEAAAKWNAMPRSNPTPVELRTAIRLAIAEDDPSYYPIHDGLDGHGLTDEQIDRCADIAASVAAGHLSGGVALDGTKLRLWCEREITAHQRKDQQQYLFAMEDIIDAIGLGDFDVEALAPGDGQDGALRWTKELPTVEGIHIYKDKYGEVWMPINIFKQSSPAPGLVYETFGSEIVIDLANLDGKDYEFYGPIAIPEPQGSDDGR